MEKLEKKKIATEIEKAINSNLKVITDDKEFDSYFKDLKWEDLNKLHDEIGSKIIEFVTNVSSLIIKKDIIDKLGDQKEHFDRLVEMFFSDINNFSFKVKEIYEQHKDKTGYVKDFNEFDHYNRISIQYNYLTTELLAISAPTISELILITKAKIDMELIDNITSKVEETVTEENKNE